MIRCACAACGRKLAVRDDLAGKKGRCPDCGAIVEIPASSPEPTVDLSALSDLESVSETVADESPPAPWSARSASEGATSLMPSRTLWLTLMCLAILIVVPFLIWLAWPSGRPDAEDAPRVATARRPTTSQPSPGRSGVTPTTPKPTDPPGTTDPGPSRPKPGVPSPPAPVAKEIPLPAPLPEATGPLFPKGGPADARPASGGNVAALRPLPVPPPCYDAGKFRVVSRVTKTVSIPAGSRLLAWSADGNRAAYWRQTSEGVEWGVAGTGAVAPKVCPGWKMAVRRWSQFSPNGRRLAFVLAGRDDRTGKWKAAVVLDGTLGKEYAEITLPVGFSPDSKHLVYFARPSHRTLDGVLVVDGVEKNTIRKFHGYLASATHPVPGAPGMLIGPSSNRAPGPLYEIAGVRYPIGIRFSPDSRSFVYVSPHKLTQACLGIDGSKRPLLFQNNSWAVWKDGDRVCAMAIDPWISPQWLVMSAGKTQPWQSDGRSIPGSVLAISPDGTRVARTAKGATGGVRVLCADLPSPDFAVIDHLSVRFLADGRLVYRAIGRPGEGVGGLHDRKDWVLVVDGVVRHDLSTGPASVDGNRCAHRTLNRIILDGVQHVPAQTSWSLTLSEDRKHAAWLARDDTTFYLVVDGAAKALPWPMACSKVAFVSPTELHGLAVRGQAVCQVQYRLVPTTTPPTTAVARRDIDATHPSTRAGQRMEALRLAGKWSLRICYHENPRLKGEWQESGKARELLYLLAQPHKPGMAGPKSVWLPSDREGDVLSHLAQEGFLETAVRMPLDGKHLPPQIGPTVTVALRTKDRAYHQDWGAEKACHNRLLALRKVLPPEAQKVFEPNVGLPFRGHGPEWRDVPGPLQNVDLDAVAAQLRRSVGGDWVKEHHLIRSVPMDLLRCRLWPDAGPVWSSYWVLPLGSPCLPKRPWPVPYNTEDLPRLVGHTDRITVLAMYSRPERDARVVAALGLTAAPVPAAPSLPPAGKSQEDRPLAVSPDGSRTAYKRGKEVYVTGRNACRFRALPGFAWIWSARFSPDSDHLAYTAGPLGNVGVALDGIPVAPPPRSGAAADLQFSPDGRRLAWKLTMGANKAAVVIDGQPSPTYDRVRSAVASRVQPDQGPVLFSPDSKHVAYAALVGTKWHMVVDGKRLPGEFGTIASAVWSPDSRYLAYFVDDRYANSVSQVMINGTLVGPRGRLDGAKDRDAHQARPLAGTSVVFSPDSASYAFVGSLPRARDPKAETKDVFVECNGLRGPMYPYIDGDTLRFLPDGRLAYSASRTVPPRGAKPKQVVRLIEHKEVSTP